MTITDVSAATAVASSDGPADSAEVAFRVQVRAFLDAHASRKSDDDHSHVMHLDPMGQDVQAAAAYQRALFDAGLAGLTWPEEYGGRGLPNRYQTIFNEEAADYDTADGDVYVIGFGMCIPTVLAHGSEAIKQRYVAPAIRGEAVWCQLFSEPAAGSDAAAARSSAVLNGDEWVLNGQKVWSSGAQFSHYGLVLARTDFDQPKHRGLSMFMVDLSLPGVTIRPIRQLNGAAHFNEVFFDDVRIPADHLLGTPGEGWRVALTTLMNERVSIGAGRSTEKASPLTHIALHLQIARERGLLDDRVVRQELADLLTRYWVLDMVGLRIRSAVAAGRPAGPEGSVAKLGLALVTPRAAAVACRLAGPLAMAWPTGDRDATRASQAILVATKAGIAGGTNEVMRNIVGERVLGLPKDPAVDRDVPFREIPHS